MGEGNEEGKKEEEGEGLVHLHRLAAPVSSAATEVGNAALVTLIYWKTRQVPQQPPLWR